MVERRRQFSSWWLDRRLRSKGLAVLAPPVMVLVIIVAVALSIVATYFAASRPARSIARIPVVTALSGRPAPPKQVRRSAVPGVIVLGGAFLLLF